MFKELQEKQNKENYKIELINRTLNIEDNLFELTKQQSQIVSYLIKNKGEFITRKEIYEKLWPEKMSTPQTINVHISTLKKKLGKYSNIIKSEHNKGYALITDKNYVHLSTLENNVYNYFKNPKNKINLEEISRDENINVHDTKYISVVLSHLRKKVPGIPLLNTTEYKNQKAYSQ